MRRFEKAVNWEQGNADFLFWCPGCNALHGVWLKSNPNPLTNATWEFNDNMDMPTVRPSILIDDGHLKCHLYITDGKIQFLDDCEHELKGQVVPLDSSFGQK